MCIRLQTEAALNQSIADLESSRKSLYLQLEDLADFRRGGISANFRKCGKRNCACARNDHPGHGPRYLWNASIGGKTHALNLPLGPELENVEQEAQRCRTFVQPREEIVAVNFGWSYYHLGPWAVEFDPALEHMVA